VVHVDLSRLASTACCIRTLAGISRAVGLDLGFGCACSVTVAQFQAAHFDRAAAVLGWSEIYDYIVA
jgi:hypothetical protein